MDLTKIKYIIYAFKKMLYIIINYGHYCKLKKKTGIDNLNIIAYGNNNKIYLFGWKSVLL